VKPRLGAEISCKPSLVGSASPDWELEDLSRAQGPGEETVEKPQRNLVTSPLAPKELVVRLLTFPPGTLTVLCVLAPFSIVSIVLIGCSAKSPITSKRKVLESKLEAIRKASKTAAVFRDQGTPADLAPSINGEVPFEPGNTLVMADTEIEQLGHEPACGGSQQKSCTDRGFGVGNLCTLDAATVLKFGRFRDRGGPHSRGYAKQCADWLAMVQYVLVVHLDQQSWGKIDAHVRGYAVLVDLGSGKGLVRLPLESTSRGTASGAIENVAGDPSKGHHRVVKKYAIPVDTLVPMELGKQLRAAFPRASIHRWPFIQPPGVR
jgi:hypothetical protein